MKNNDLLYAEEIRQHEVAEEKHFWFTSRLEFILYFVKEFFHENCSLLDIGAGTGFIASKMQTLGFKVSAIEQSDYGKKLISKREKINLIDSNLEELDQALQYDVVTMFDVLEHIEKDAQTLKTIADHIKINGLLLLTVPAFQFLWSEDDVQSDHKRRYTKSAIHRILNEAGYEIVISRYFFVAIFPLLILRSIFWKFGLKGLSNQESSSPSSLVNSILNIVCHLENSVLKWIAFPFGGSLLVLARRV